MDSPPEPRDPLDEALRAARGLLRDLAASQPANAVALERASALAERFPAYTIRLVWERLPFESATHYDVLLRDAASGVWSVSVGPLDATPWPLRGARLWGERDIVGVNGRMISVEQLMEHVDYLFDQPPLAQQVVDAVLVDDAVDTRGLVPSTAHLQRAMDSFRRSHGLLSARDTQGWMEARALTHPALERLLAADAAMYALQEHVAPDTAVTAHLAAHSADFDLLVTARLRLFTPADAQPVADAVRDGRLSFAAACEAAHADGRAATTGQAYAERRRRIDLPAAERAAAAAARPGELIGPLPHDFGADLLHVLAIVPAVPPEGPDDATLAAARRTLFEAWLAEARLAATIEWFWGPAT